MTFGAGYAASRISSNLKGSTKQFGWLQAPIWLGDSSVMIHSARRASTGFTVEARRAGR
jgi:hypothetical protein